MLLPETDVSCVPMSPDLRVTSLHSCMNSKVCLRAFVRGFTNWREDAQQTNKVRLRRSHLSRLPYLDLPVRPAAQIRRSYIVSLKERPQTMRRKSGRRVYILEYSAE